MYVSATQAPIETKNPQVNLLVTKWQHVWLLALDRRRKLNDSMDRLEEVLTASIQLDLKCHVVTASSQETFRKRNTAPGAKPPHRVSRRYR